jgi:hypothetical protein
MQSYGVLYEQNITLEVAEGVCRKFAKVER